MAEKVSVPLSRPLKGPNGASFTEVVLREPSYDEIVEVGDPYFIAMTRDNVPFQVENADAIKSYLARCIEQPKDAALLSQLKARDVVAVKDKLLAFFLPDVPTTAESKTPPTT